jgi:hypothetical protein
MLRVSPKKMFLKSFQSLLKLMSSFGSLGFFGVIIFFKTITYTSILRESEAVLKKKLKSYTYNTHKQSGYSDILTLKKKMDI